MDNPFLKILQQQAQQGGMPGGGQGNSPEGLGTPPTQPGGQAMATAPDSGMPGETADSTKPLIQAMNALHGFIAQSTDKQDIAVVRSLMILLGKVIQKDQEKSMQSDQQGAAPAGGAMPPMGGGMPPMGMGQ